MTLKSKSQLYKNKDTAHLSLLRLDFGLWSIRFSKNLIGFLYLAFEKFGCTLYTCITYLEQVSLSHLNRD